MKLILILLFVTISAMGQTDTTTVAKNQKVPFKEVTPENAFKASVKHNTIRIYILGGIASAVREKELEFAKKYNVTFHDFGCVAPVNLSFYEAYNQLVFQHLTTTFGTEWLKEINPKVIGISKYKEI